MCVVCGGGGFCIGESAPLTPTHLQVGIGFVALPLDCINSFVHRPKMLTAGEARNQRKALMKRSEELIKVGEEMASALIDVFDNARNKVRRGRGGGAL